jgi:hypothetical protein
MMPTVTEDLITLYIVIPDPDATHHQIVIKKVELGILPVKGMRTLQSSIVLQTLSTLNNQWSGMS